LQLQSTDIGAANPHPFWRRSPAPLTTYYPSRRNLSAALEAFISLAHDHVGTVS
jgi:hypothetical protein